MRQNRFANSGSYERWMVSFSKRIGDGISTGIDQGTAEFKSLRSMKDLSTLTLPLGLKAATKETIAYGIGICASAELAP